MDLALTSGKASPLKSLSSEHFPEKKFAKHSALSLLEVCSRPSSPVRMGISWWRPHPLMRFIVDHHWRLDKVPLFILRRIDRLCAYFALWTTLVAASVEVLYALSRDLQRVGCGGVVAMPFLSS